MTEDADLGIRFARFGQHERAAQAFARAAQLLPILSEGAHEDLLWLLRPWAENGSLADLCADPEDPAEPVIVAALALDAAGAATLAGVAMADEGETYDAVEVEAERDVLLSELGNILLNGLLGGMQPRLGKGLLVRLPTYREGSRCAEALALPLPGAGLLVRADLHLGEAEVPLRLVLALAGAEAAAVLDGGVPT